MLLEHHSREHGERNEEEPGGFEQGPIAGILPETVADTGQHAPHRERVHYGSKGVADSIARCRQQDPDADTHEWSDEETRRGHPHRPAHAEKHEDCRPEQIELLFDGERPGVPERPRAMRVVVPDVREGVAEIAGAELHPAQAGRGGHRDQEHVVGDEDAEDAAEVEHRKTDRAALLLLVEQQPGDQVSGNDEEHPHAEDGEEREDDAGRSDREPSGSREMAEYHQ